MGNHAILLSMKAPTNALPSSSRHIVRVPKEHQSRRLPRHSVPYCKKECRAEVMTDASRHTSATPSEASINLFIRPCATPVPQRKFSTLSQARSHSVAHWRTPHEALVARSRIVRLQPRVPMFCDARAALRTPTAFFSRSLRSYRKLPFISNGAWNSGDI